jgi:hypothetical protein
MRTNFMPKIEKKCETAFPQMSTQSHLVHLLIQADT